MSNFITKVADKLADPTLANVVLKISANPEEGIKLLLVREQGFKKEILSDVSLQYQPLDENGPKGAEDAIEMLFKKLKTKSN